MRVACAGDEYFVGNEVHQFEFLVGDLYASSSGGSVFYISFADRVPVQPPLFWKKRLRVE